MSVNQIFLTGLGCGLGFGALALCLCSAYSLTRHGLKEI